MFGHNQHSFKFISSILSDEKKTPTMHLPALIPLYMKMGNRTPNSSNKGLCKPHSPKIPYALNSPHSAKFAVLVTSVPSQKSPISAPLRGMGRYEDLSRVVSPTLQQENSATFSRENLSSKKRRFSEHVEVHGFNAENIVTEPQADTVLNTKLNSKPRASKDSSNNSNRHQVKKLEAMTPEQVSTPSSITLDDESLRSKTDRNRARKFSREKISLPQLSFKQHFKQQGLETQQPLEASPQNKIKSILKKENRKYSGRDYYEPGKYYCSKSLPELSPVSNATKKVEFTLN